MKTYLPTETKAERKTRKARDKAGLSPIVKTNNKNYVCCLKWGDKYSSDYVNNLYNMVQRNLELPYEFVCFTENSTNLNPAIRVEPLPQLPVQGWWYKPYFLSSEIPLKGTLLFIDLDVVIFRNIDKLFTHEPGKFCIIRDFNRSIRASWDKMNSSVFRVETGKYNNQWQDFKSNLKSHLIKNRGDQDWMFRNIKDHVFWPDDWIQSYKWEMRDRSTLKLINGKRNFINNDSPKVKPNTSIAVFHGDPNPADCTDTWVKANWK
jgi:hypothetical protein